MDNVITHTLIGAESGEVLCETSATSDMHGTSALSYSQLLRSLPHSEYRNSGTWNGQCYHYLHEQGLFYLCISGPQVPLRVVFGFLEDISCRYRAHCAVLSRGPISSFTPSAPLMRHSLLFLPTLKQQLHHFNDPRTDRLTSVKKQIDEVKNVMLENIDAVLSRGENIDTLMDRTSELKVRAENFQHGSKTLSSKMWWNNVRMVATGCLAVGFIFLLLLMMMCDPNFEKCRR